MKILFIYPDIITPMINFCPAVHSLSAFMKAHGHQTALIHINDTNGTPMDKERITDLARSAKPDLIAVTATSFNYSPAKKIASWLKAELPSVPRIMGGAHATVEPMDIKNSDFNAFCVGEGEEPLLDLTQAIQSGKDWHSIKNLIVKLDDGSIKHNPARGYLKNLDFLPFLDFDITDTRRILKARHGWLSISFSRGCPFECTFCINHIYKELTIGPNDKMSDYIRKRSPEKTVAELKALTLKFKDCIKVFNFDDDLLPMDKAWMREFAKLYTRDVFKPYGIKYAINCRAPFLDRSLAKLLADSGCLEVRIGFETGSEAQRRTILAKNVSDADLIKAFSACDEYGVHTNAFAMMGLPGENQATFNDTVRMITVLKPYLIRMTFLHPYAHTRIYDYCVENNLFKPGALRDDSFTESPLQFPEMSDADIFRCRFLFPWHVNIALFGNESKDAASYAQLVKQFEKLPFEQLRNMVPEIIKADTEADAACHRPHYRYFGGNAYYFQLTKRT